ncbi:hypothetical protein Dhaf_1215 [Desulfitobacterium hafniense DCB-2]|uniref:Uncharacterized protein n=1 Tax=Desulfitobacterium hafniense (strain DSM 10664 / DCB-2) TaxID=272564 RepID=B8G157_DESHD|nr:hypothetical protein [Desulfitobacterium hafniense]ACL19272.1 hypothetical protein Dhaf_1215 [Desulfitobacterium hafniense DCB-2]
MDRSELARAQSRKDVYFFLYTCLSRDPSFQFILSLLGEHFDRCFVGIKEVCPSCIEFEKALQTWKVNTKVRKRVREDYTNLSHRKEGFKELCGLLKQMEELVNKEIIIRQADRREQVDGILLAQIKLLEEHSSKYNSQRIHDITCKSFTEFYRSLFYTVSEFLAIDFKELKKMLDYCIA